MKIGAGVLALAAATALLDLGGVAGYRAGLVIVAIPLVGGSALLFWWLLRRNPARTQWVIVTAIFGLIATAVLGTRAPDSRGVLERQLDELTLPFFEVEKQTESGHSWCAPSCPRVERTYDVPDVGVQSTMVTVGIALAKAGLMTDDDLRSIGKDRFLRIRSDRVEIEVRVDEGEGDAVESVRIRLESRRPA